MSVQDGGHLRDLYNLLVISRLRIGLKLTMAQHWTACCPPQR